MSEKALCEVNMTYATMRSYFRAAERARQHLSGFIVGVFRGKPHLCGVKRQQGVSA